jgi:hypothetical protein
MSEPTYKIVTEHDPAATYNPWTARVTRLSDELEVYVGYGTTEAEALAEVQGSMVAGPAHPGRTLYATEDGTITEQVPA